MKRKINIKTQRLFYCTISLKNLQNSESYKVWIIIVVTKDKYKSALLSADSRPSLKTISLDIFVPRKGYVKWRNFFAPTD